MTAATITKSRRYVEASIDAPHAAEALVLTVWPDKSDGTRRRFRLLLEGAYAIQCQQGHVHPVAIHEQSVQWVDDAEPDDDHMVVLGAYEQDEDDAERLITRMLGWALNGWAPPCQQAVAVA